MTQKFKIGVNFEKCSLKRESSRQCTVKTKRLDFISKEDSTISVLVRQREIATPYEKGISFREYVNRAGGVKQSSDYKNSYVVYQNGDVRGTKSVFRLRPKLEPGAIVIVPIKDKRRKITIQETIGMTSALASLTLLVDP